MGYAEARGWPFGAHRRAARRAALDGGREAAALDLHEGLWHPGPPSPLICMRDFPPTAVGALLICIRECPPLRLSTGGTALDLHEGISTPDLRVLLICIRQCPTLARKVVKVG
jgi:hypothetical protein